MVRSVIDASRDAIASYNNSLSEMRSEYAAAQRNRFMDAPRGIHHSGSGADYHYSNEHDLYLMSELAHRLVRDDQVVSQGIRRLVANVVQGGFTYKPDVGNDSIERELKDRWHSWSTNKWAVDYRGKFEFCEHERLAMEAMIVAGDISFSPLRNGSLQQFEFHRLRSPRMVNSTVTDQRKWVHGVETVVDRLEAYHVTKTEYDGINSLYRSFSPSDLTRIPAQTEDPLVGGKVDNFFHLYNPRRFTQSRGVSAAVPVLPTCTMHDDISFAAMVAQKMCTFIALVHNVEPNKWDEWEQYAGLKGEDTTGNRSTSDYEVHRPGAEFFPNGPGETLEPFSPNIPSPQFFDHSRLLLTFIAVNLDLPLVILLLDSSETNFSGWRGALDQAKISWTHLQKTLARGFNRPTADWKVRQWMRQSADLRRFYTQNGPAIFHHTWGFPRWPYIEPQKDVEADAAEIRHMLASPRMIAERKNLDFAVIVKETCEDRKLQIACAMDAAEELNKHPFVKANPEQKIGWREIAFPPDGSQIQLKDPTEGENLDKPGTDKSGAPGGKPVPAKR